LIQAIETVPEAGRVAVFVNRDRAVPEFVSAPSFRPDEVSTLAGLVEKSCQSAIDTGPFEVELRGGPSANLVRLFPLRVPGERPTAILVTVRDPIDDDERSVFDAFMDQISQLAGIVVEDRRLRSRIADQQSVMEALLGAAPDAIIHIAQDGTILDFRGSAPKMFGWERKEIIGQLVSVLMPDPHASRHGDYIDAFLHTGERKLPGFGRRLQARHKNGTLFPVEIALSQLDGRDGAEFIGIVRDISHRVEREGEMEDMREALDAASRQSALGELAATIAHELNQPLTAVANYMDALELRLQAPTDENLDTARDLARKTAAQARLGAEIIRRTRRMALKGETETRPDDFHAAVAEAVSLVSKTQLARGTAIRLLRSGSASPVAFDRVQVQQVVINLTTNALHAMESSGREELTVETEQTGEHARLIVRDTGPGVCEADKTKIFDRFYRRSKNGMGLGLAVVRRIAVAHGGTIEVGDVAGGGARFTLTLPILAL